MAVRIISFKDDEDYIKVHDHDHITGKYVGAAHNKCNLNRNFKNFKIPVIFHNLKGYDSHFIIKALSKYKLKKEHIFEKLMYAKQGQKISAFIDKIKIIPLTEEKYISFTIEDLKFIDSLSFLPSSLEKLVENLKNGDKNDLSAFHVTKHFMKLEYPDITDEQMLLLCQKGVVPYEYMDSFDKYNETQLPPIESFRNKLNDEECNPKGIHLRLKTCMIIGNHI